MRNTIVVTLSALLLSFFALAQLGGAQTVPTGGAGLISQPAYIPVATTSASGVVKAPNCATLGSNYFPQSLNVDGSWNCLPVSSETYTLPALTASALGGVKGTGTSLSCGTGNHLIGFAADGTMQCASDPSVPVTSVFSRTGSVTAQSGDYTAAQVGAVPTSTTVNGHPLSANVTISATDLNTGTLPHAQLPALVSGDIPNNAANTSGTATGFTGSLVGDVTGTQSNTVVNKVNGASVPASAALLATNSGSQLTAVSTLPASAEPAHTGDVSNTAGSLAMTVNALKGLTLPALTSQTGYLYDNNGTLSLNVPSGSGTVNGNSTGNSHALTVYNSNSGSTTVQADTAAYTDGAGNLTVASVTTTGTNPDTWTAIADPGSPTNGQDWYSSTTSGRRKFYDGTAIRTYVWSSDLPTNPITGSSTQYYTPYFSGSSALSGASVTGLVYASTSGVPTAATASQVATVLGSASLALVNTTATVGTTAIAANTCASQTAVTMTGLASTMTLQFTPNANTATVTGWGSPSAGLLYIVAYPTANTVNWSVCNPTSSSITPSSSVTFNVSAR